MKNHKILLLLLLSVFAACCSQQQARRPVSHSEGTFMKESAERNKKLIAGEEGKIDSIIKSNPNQKYIGSKKGYYYTYIKQNATDTIRPKKGDIAYFNYELSDLDGNIIYSELELRPQEYHVDKEQKIMMGLRHGIKLMHKNETVKFLFPSHMGYGYHGDNRRIGHNQPLICTVTLTDIKPENQTTSE
ncbi:gliding motility-associated peptidyl-prolyl isomerase GldI [Flavobacterium sp. MAH-1]|uniref:Peptidyl-prolyl cis-trans isomerase n=1 Tax=Flavobacterium agri TaxID=2743471 RepID=A0A7Y8Y5T3_9FLAO|nr:gliding motility-associated peptidyl-prolyl isomerase GldI [Flavobacterium agri]NUY82439.1 gliding motility-associated peptidyl-prolyl isomerase GldI [Flavobacterium agri]NYA72463.1 gliding motility-associated peptidyl-prolyl isomerase GldI [Flavobacterium agri]